MTIHPDIRYQHLNIKQMKGRANKEKEEEMHLYSFQLFPEPYERNSFVKLHPMIYGSKTYYLFSHPYSQPSYSLPPLPLPLPFSLLFFSFPLSMHYFLSFNTNEIMPKLLSSKRHLITPRITLGPYFRWFNHLRL